MIMQVNEPQLIRWDEQQTFALKDFIRFITPTNIIGFSTLLNDACYHIERQANGKILFLNLSLQIHRLLHEQKTVSV